MSPPKKKMSSMKGWLIRKIHTKTSSLRFKHKSNTNIANKNTLTKNNVTKQTISNHHHLKRNTTTSQLKLDGTVIVHEDLIEYGHPYNSTLSTANTFRIHSQNIQNIPVEAYKLKSQSIAKELKKKLADVYMWQEVGLCWSKVSKNDTWKSRTQRLHLHSNFAYNNTDIKNSVPYQPGGVGVILTNTLSPRVIGKGTDPTGLGRWAWTRLRGKERAVTMLSAYRPCKPSTAGIQTVYEQHARVLPLYQEPRSQFLLDLRKSIEKIQVNGDVVFVGMDLNDPIERHDFHKFFAELNMHEAILVTHTKTRPPATNILNLANYPIDGLWCSTCIKPVRAGYSKFGTGILSDHRTIWAEFRNDEVFGSNDKVRHKVTQLKPNDPRDVEKYVTRASKLLQQEQCYERMTSLQKIPVQNFKQQHQQQYDSALTQITSIRKHVKSNLRHVFRGEVMWSPRYKQVRSEKRLWLQLTKYRARAKTGKNISLTAIRRLMRQTELRKALQCTKDEIEDNLSKACKKFREVHKEAAALHQAYRLSLDKVLANKNGTTEEIERKLRMRIERQRDMGRAVRRVKRKMFQPVTKLSFTDEQGTHDCYTQKDIAAVCIVENKKRFSQSRSTPPMHASLIERIGYNAEKEGGKQILDGTFVIPSGTQKYMIKVIEKLRKPNSVKAKGDIGTDISLEEHVTGWKKQKDRTASVTSELTFNDFKAGVQDPYIAELDRISRQIPLEKGFSPQGYKKITDFPILKKAGTYEVEAMRTIQLFSAAFNMNNKKTGRDVIRRAEELHLIPEEQSGSRKHRRAVLTALNKVLVTDISRQLRLPLTVTSNDAKACFDRIVLWVASLALQRIGLSSTAAFAMTNTLQSATHNIKTAYGESNQQYTSTWPPLQGSGQGNGAGPTIWVMISAILLTIMKEEGFGLNVISCLSHLSIAIAGFAFVDDTDIINAANTVETTGEELLDKQQLVIDTWEGALRATGGALRQDKSYWYMIDYVYSSHTWQYRTKEQLKGDISVQVDNDVRERLERLEPHSAKETLGIFVAMDGNSKDEINHLLTKTRQMAEYLRTANITKTETWYTFTAAFMKTLEYPMEAICLTREQWEKVMSPLLSIVLQKSGITQVFPRTMIYSSTKYHGLGVLHPWYHQQIKHLQTLIGETANNTPTGKLFQASAEQLRLEIGLPGTFKDVPWDQLTDIITSTWMSKLLSFLGKHKIDVHDPLPQLQLQRKGDIFLMQCFLLTQPSKHELRMLMDCREYLQVTTLADITSAAGDKILLPFWNGTTYSRKVGVTGWPRKPPGKKLDWRLWQHTLRPLLRNNSLFLKQQLVMGKWTQEALLHWKWQYSLSQGRLYATHGQVITEYKRMGQPALRHSLGTYERVDKWTDKVPEDSKGADVYHTSNVKLISFVRHVDLPAKTRIETFHDLATAKQSLPTDDQWAINEMFSEDQGAKVARAIQRGDATGISDGSYKNKRGTAACIIEANKDTSSRIYALHDTPGRQTDQSPYRSELSGISMMLAVIKCVLMCHKVTSGSIALGLDGEKAMTQASGNFPLFPTQRSFDLLVDIRTKLEQLPIKVHFFWVEGHQLQRHGQQSYMGEINDKCDLLAKMYWRMKEGELCKKSQLFHDSPWTFSLGGTVYSNLDKQEVYDYTYGKTDSVPYWQDNRHSFPTEQEQTISWHSITKAFKTWPWGKTKWMTKFWTGFAPVGRVMKRRKEWQHDMCPRCFSTNETSMHVLQCPEQSSRTQWETSISKLEETLVELRTHPSIITVWKSRLLSWGDSRIFPFTAFSLGVKVYRATNEQDAINWKHFLMGRLSDFWEDAQQEWIVRTSTKWKRSSHTWMIKVIQAVWETSW